MNPIQLAGLAFAGMGIGLLAVGLQFPQLTYCVGAPLAFGICLGATVNYTWAFWAILLGVGVLLVVLGRGRRR